MLLLPFYLTGALSAAAVLAFSGAHGAIAALWAALALIGGFFGGILLAVLLCGALSLLHRRGETPERPNRFWSAVAGYAFGVICALARIRIRAEGLERIPEGRWLLVCNHRSAFDPLVTGCLLHDRQIAFISKEENFRIPIAGRVISTLCYLALDRENNRAALQTILRAAGLMRSDAVSYCIYPEGTRNKGEGLLPFRNGAFKIAQKARSPVVAAYLDGTERVHKNFPWRHTDVSFTVCGVLDAGAVQQMKTNEIGERIRQCIDSAGC